MSEQQPNPNKRPLPVMDAKPLDQSEPKSFSGIAIGEVFMFPRLELTPEQKEGLREAIRNIIQHRS